MTEGDKSNNLPVRRAYPSSSSHWQEEFAKMSQPSVAWAEIGNREAKTKVKLREEIAKDLIFIFPPDVSHQVTRRPNS